MGERLACMDCRHWQSVPAGSTYASGLCGHPNLVEHLDPTTGWVAGPHNLYILSSSACREVLSLCAGEAKWFEPLVKE
jgi:hypothetical protein